MILKLEFYEGDMMGQDVHLITLCNHVLLLPLFYSDSIRFRHVPCWKWCKSAAGQNQSGFCWNLNVTVTQALIQT